METKVIMPVDEYNRLKEMDLESWGFDSKVYHLVNDALNSNDILWKVIVKNDTDWNNEHVHINVKVYPNNTKIEELEKQLEDELIKIKSRGLFKRIFNIC